MGADDPDTLAFYAAEAPVYAASGPGGASRHLAGFLDRLAPPRAHPRTRLRRRARCRGGGYDKRQEPWIAVTLRRA